MTLPIHRLRVDHFRAFKDLAVGPCGRVNLVTGKNNSGKSSLLEAIRIFATGGSTATLDSIVSYREEAESGNPQEIEAELPGEGAFPYSSLFFGFPSLAEASFPFTVTNEPAEGAPSALTVRVGFFVRGLDRSSPTMFRAVDPQLEPGAFPMLEVTSSELDQQRHTWIFSRIRNRSERGDSAVGGMPCVYLDPSSSRTTAQMAALWDAIALTDEERQVVAALRILAPDIEAVSVIGGDPRLRQRTAIAKSRKYRRPVPLRSFGDGVVRLFGITLSLARAKGGILLIDEVENGLHHSIMPDVWRLVFQMADALDVQIFATTHSWDCIRAFQEAANHHPATGVLIRLTARDTEIIPTIFHEDELRIATRDGIEVR